MLARSLPYWPINPLLSTSPWFTFQIDMVRCLWAILPAALLWGASFPLALAAAAALGRRGPRPPGGRRVCGQYRRRHRGRAQLQPDSDAVDRHAGLRAGADCAGGDRRGGRADCRWWRSARTILGAAGLAAALAVAGWLAANVSGVPPMLIAYGRRIATSMGRSKILYAGEGMNSSIAISQWDDGAIQFHVSGKVEASTEPYDMRLQRMLGHLPALIHPNPKSVLIVGFGAGVTAGTFVLHPGGEAHRDLRNGAADSARRHALFRQGELQRAARSAHADRLRRRAPLRAHHAGEVRHHHLRPDSSLGEGQRHALLEGVLRAGEGAPEARAGS